MAAKKKRKTRSPRANAESVFSREDLDSLTPQEKLRYLEVTKDGGANWQKFVDHVPDLLKECIAIYTKHFGERVKITRASLWAHLGLLAVGTGAVTWLGLASVLEGATIVAILGPLYTYVLVNLRQLTAGQAVMDTTESQS